MVSQSPKEKIYKEVKMSKTATAPKVVKYQTVILDTSTEVETVLRQATFEEIRAASTKNRERMMPNEYTMRNLKMTALFDKAKQCGVNLVSLQYMKEKWTKVAENQFVNTGEMMIDGWQRTESAADVVLEVDKTRITVVSHRWMSDPLKFPQESKSKNYDDLMVEVIPDWFGDDEEYPNLAFSLTGRAKSGKNHFAYTFPDPIKVYCFNGGAGFITKRFPKKHIDVMNFTLPIIDDPKDTSLWAEPIWNKFYKDYNETMERSKQ